MTKEAKDKLEEKSLKKPINYVGFGWRMISQVIDIAVIGIILSPLMNLFNNLYYSDEVIEIMQNPELQAGLEMSYALEIMLPIMAFQVIVMALYLIIFWSIWGATPGKMLLSFKIVDEKTGNNLTVIQSIKRLIGYFIALLPFGIGFIAIHYSKNKRGIHDIVAGTVVIEKGKKIR